MTIRKFHSSSISEVGLRKDEVPAIVKVDAWERLMPIEAPEDPPRPGEWVSVNEAGKLARAVAGVDAKAFVLPPNAQLSEDGTSMFWWG